MNILGIIAEYNPFHNGHLYQLQKSIEMTNADFVVVVMSGNFTQRGEPAIFPKKIRAQAAVLCGVDLVIELPFAFACNNAEYFAKGAMSILNGLGCVTHISFGSESGDLTVLKTIADFLSHETTEFKDHLKVMLDSGISYPRARAEAVNACLGQDVTKIMGSPNNILAIEYLKQLNLLESNIIPFTVKRHATDYHDTTLAGDIASASAIRNVLTGSNPNASDITDPINSNLLHEISDFVPSIALKTITDNIHDIHLGASPQDAQNDLYYKLLASRLLTIKKHQLSEIFSVSEGLENRLKSAIRSSSTLFDLKTALKSKRYTTTRIDRILIHTLVGLTKTDFHAILNAEKYYARILGFNENGAKLLKHIKKSKESTIPCITNINKEADKLVDSQLLLSYDLISSDLYNLLTNKNIYTFSEQLYEPFHL